MQLDSLVSKPVRILLGSPVRKAPDTLAAFLRSVARQVLPAGVTLDHAFVDDNTDPVSSSALLMQFPNATILQGTQATGDFSDAAGPTHQWTPQAMNRVGEAKNRLIRLALEQGYDYLWLVDCDLILGPTTLLSLYHTDGPIVCGVFWTRWQDTPDCPPLPQVWLRHPYQLDGRGKDQPTFLHDLATRQRVPVWGQGACTLYRTDVFRKGVSFTLLPDLPTEGMWIGEDRHLCTRAERLHVPMLGDGWPDIFHVYHDRQRAEIPEWEAKLSTVEEGFPTLHSLVSLHLQPLEPIPTEGGGMAHIPRQHSRGVLGRMGLAPELEATVLDLQRGQSKIVKVTYPIWSKSPLRGQKRLIEVTLVDHKPFANPVSA